MTKKQQLKEMTETNLFKMFREENDLEAKDEIIERMIYLVYKLVAKYYSTFLTQDDLKNEGIIGLLESMNTFDYNRGYRFSTYAYRGIKNRLSRAVVQSQDGGVHIPEKVYYKEIKRFKKDGHSDVLNNMNNLCNQFGDEQLFDDVFSKSYYIDIDSISNSIMIDKIYSLLDEWEQEFLDKKFGLHGQEKMTIEQMAEFYKKSDTTIDNYYYRIMNKLIDLSPMFS